jgi:hypothetical protein
LQCSNRVSIVRARSVIRNQPWLSGMYSFELFNCLQKCIETEFLAELSEKRSVQWLDRTQLPFDKFLKICKSICWNFRLNTMFNTVQTRYVIAEETQLFQQLVFAASKDSAVAIEAEMTINCVNLHVSG